VLVFLGEVEPFFNHRDNLIHLKVAEDNQSHHQNHYQNGIGVYPCFQLLLLSLDEIAPLNYAWLFCSPNHQLISLVNREVAGLYDGFLY
jgi:hypothetical protein